MSQVIIYKDGEYLQHYGVKGQKWGVRRYQNEDGTLTEAGRKRHREIEKWYNSRAGKRDLKFVNGSRNRAGHTEADMFNMRKVSKSMGVGWFIGGIAGGLIASVVTTKRLEQGKAFTQDVINNLKDLESHGISNT